MRPMWPLSFLKFSFDFEMPKALAPTANRN